MFNFFCPLPSTPHMYRGYTMKPTTINLIQVPLTKWQFLTPKKQLLVELTIENLCKFLMNSILVRCLQNFDARYKHVPL